MAYRPVSKTGGLYAHEGSTPSSPTQNMIIVIPVILFIFLVCFGLFVLFFVSRRFSPIPYFPSNHKDITKIIQFLALRDKDILYDLGAGDGVVIFEAATTSLASSPRPLKTRFVAVELNPILVLVIKARALFHPARAHITVTRDDIFTMTIPRSPGYSPVFFTYISPWFMEKTILNLLRQYKSIELVSYFYAAPRSKHYRITIKKHTRNIHDIYRYRIVRRRRV